jgi:archaemetzincin
MVRVLMMIAIVACGTEAPGLDTRRTREPQREPEEPQPPRVLAIGDVSIRTPAVQRALDWHHDFEPMGKPAPDEWMAAHPEPAQTFDAYTNAVAHVPSEPRKVIYLLPLGAFPADAVAMETMATVVRAYFTLEVRVLPAVPIQQVAVRSRINDGTNKRQFHAPQLLDWLKPRVPDDAYALMAITMEDLYPHEDWNFVFGMASFDERVGVQSLARQDPAFFGQPRGADWKQLALRRATWTMVHEISHMFGLAHCQYWRCIVAGSNHQEQSDKAPLHPCPVCLHKLWWAIRFDPAVREANLAKTLRELGIADEADWSERRARWIRDGTR